VSAVARTGLIHHPACLEHFAGPGHPERPERLAAVLARLRKSGLWSEIDVREATPATPALLRANHDAAYVESVAAACGRGRAMLDGGDTYVCTESHEAALRASGGVLDACRNVLAGDWSNAFVAIRPPGHHAEEDHAMGFCLFNNVAVAARWLRANGIARVAIVDFDVHHGNGTQHSFERDASVFYASLHQYPHYPGTGAASERGLGEGRGATLNLPQSAGTGDREWLGDFERVLVPALEDFAPEFVLVSAGFDAHRDDPLSGTRVTEAGYRTMTEDLLAVANKSAKGRLVSVLEGGYNLESLASSAETHVAALTSRA
jgi:acetoin utilization deacetylase AcuC-like enzyme